jgi:2,3-bisphosphoglycerate-dependent phosphoglycerate mutase
MLKATVFLAFIVLNMKTTLYFIRHSEVDSSVKEDKIRPLTLDGVQKAKNLNRYFDGITVDAVYSSPYIRVTDTLKEINSIRNLNLIESENLREREIGQWLDDFIGYTKKQWADFSYKIENGESLSEVQARNITEIEKILNANNGKTVVVGTHGTALSTIINYYHPQFTHESFLSIVNKMPYVIKMEFENLVFSHFEEILIPE